LRSFVFGPEPEGDSHDSDPGSICKYRLLVDGVYASAHRGPATVAFLAISIRTVSDRAQGRRRRGLGIIGCDHANFLNLRREAKHSGGPLLLATDATAFEDPLSDDCDCMTQRPLRVLLIGSHPVQYATPIFRLLARDSRVDIQVAYCSLQGALPDLDPGFGVRVKWDIPLLEGYSWTSLPNRAWTPRVGSFFGLVNPGIWQLISRGNFDAIVLFTGYVCATFWIAIASAKWNGTSILFGTDAHDLASRDHKRWKRWVKTRLWPRLFRLANRVIVVSSGGAAMMRSLGIPESRIALTPFCVNNEWWIEQADRVDRAFVRARWDVPENAAVILFCAKLQPWKRPQDLLQAFARIADLNAYLVFAGDGTLRPLLESEARSRGIADRVRFLGFVNQSGLPETYAASDILVLPSEYEPFGLVVNEAMLCRCPVIVSDRVGARFDLINEGRTGFVFPCGDIDVLAELLRRALNDRFLLGNMREAVREKMIGWSPTQYVAALIQAIGEATGQDNRPKMPSDG
jgi:glycosyltransferase involved in cell wall biosynthesis